ncbi:TetR/AcrR family transcriptional regulator [Paenibacillus sp. GCM10023252]|uniref:TetR/AcrR family transcriptional regulator n=1 Tax=Paenibacillus sp. GCM10023252 TaxID=3252649 RepID=UPI003613056A
MSSTGNGKRKDAEELSSVILQTAKSLFTEHGVDSVSMHQVAKSAGIGQGTLYRRYANKGDLCMDLMKDTFQSFMDQVDALMTEYEHQQSNVLERVQLFLRQIIQFIEEQSGWVSVVQHYQFCEPDRFNFHEAPPYEYISSKLKGLFHEAQDNGVLIPHIDIALTTHILIYSLSPDSFNYLRSHYGYTTEELCEHYLQSFVNPLFTQS